MPATLLYRSYYYTAAGHRSSAQAGYHARGHGMLSDFLVVMEEDRSRSFGSLRARNCFLHADYQTWCVRTLRSTDYPSW